MAEILRRQSSRKFLAKILPASLLGVPAAAATRELWWMNQE
jgi:hypothetical protein